MTEASRHHRTHNYILTWKRNTVLKELQVINKCGYQYCNITSENEKLIHPSFNSASVICRYLNISTSNFDSLLVCHKHYSTMYRVLDPVVMCASCGARSKVGTAFIRHSPNAFLVNDHFH